jgi:hypothetical protein
MRAHLACAGPVQVVHQALGDDRGADARVQRLHDCGQRLRAGVGERIEVEHAMPLRQQAGLAEQAALERRHVRQVGLEVSQAVTVLAHHAPAAPGQAGGDLDDLADAAGLDLARQYRINAGVPRQHQVVEGHAADRAHRIHQQAEGAIQSPAARRRHRRVRQAQPYPQVPGGVRRRADLFRAGHAAGHAIGLRRRARRGNRRSTAR